MQKCRMHVGGNYVDAASGKWFDSYNAYTGEPWAQIAQGDAEDAGRPVRAEHKAYRTMAATRREANAACGAMVTIPPVSN